MDNEEAQQAEARRQNRRLSVRPLLLSFLFPCLCLVSAIGLHIRHNGGLAGLAYTVLLAPLFLALLLWTVLASRHLWGQHRAANPFGVRVGVVNTAIAAIHTVFVALIGLKLDDVVGSWIVVYAPVLAGVACLGVYGCVLSVMLRSREASAMRICRNVALAVSLALAIYAGQMLRLEDVILESWTSAMIPIWIFLGLAMVLFSLLTCIFSMGTAAERNRGAIFCFQLCGLVHGVVCAVAFPLTAFTVVVVKTDGTGSGIFIPLVCALGVVVVLVCAFPACRVLCVPIDEFVVDEDGVATLRRRRGWFGSVRDAELNLHGGGLTANQLDNLTLDAFEGGEGTGKGGGSGGVSGSEEGGEQPARCAICLADFEAGDEVVRLPCSDDHIFHPSCIRPWLKMNPTCPLCKQNVRDAMQPPSLSPTGSRPPPPPPAVARASDGRVTAGEPIFVPIERPPNPGDVAIATAALAAATAAAANELSSASSSASPAARRPVRETSQSSQSSMEDAGER